MIPGHPDVIVVGAGTSGSVVASRLSEDATRSVLLVEAGPDFPAGADGLPAALRRDEARVPAPDHLWGYEATVMSRSARTIPIFRGRAVGGSGAINGAIFVRGLPEDYDAWDSPLWTYEAVLPFFTRSERDLDRNGPLHGQDGPVPVRRLAPERWPASQRALRAAALDAGFPEWQDLADARGAGVGALPHNSDPRDIRMSAALTHLQEARSRPNLHVRGQARATRLLLEDGRAVGVEILDVGTGVPEVILTDDVILSAGAIGTPHLLMHSGIGPAVALERLGIAVVADLRGVGQNLRDHPCVSVGLEAPHVGEEDARHHALVAWTADGSARRNDMNIIMSAIRPPDAGIDVPMMLDLCVILEAPESSGAVTLASGDPLALPHIALNYLEGATDRKRLREGVRVAAALADHAAFSDLGVIRVAPDDPVLDDDGLLDEWVAQHAGTLFHSCGTCRMGPAHDRDAVVDDHGRVHGIDGLRVADLSIAPEVPRAPTNATAFMIGERLAALYDGTSVSIP